jgi:hypothetical protein
MLKKDVVEHFGTQERVALVLGISRQAVQMWGDVVPLLRAYQLERRTGGKLTIDPPKRQKKALTEVRAS